VAGKHHKRGLGCWSGLGHGVEREGGGKKREKCLELLGAK